jgi:hypothetical protein
MTGLCAITEEVIESSEQPVKKPAKKSAKKAKKNVRTRRTSGNAVRSRN